MAYFPSETLRGRDGDTQRPQLDTSHCEMPTAVIHTASWRGWCDQSWLTCRISPAFNFFNREMRAEQWICQVFYFKGIFAPIFKVNNNRKYAKNLFCPILAVRKINSFLDLLTQWKMLERLPVWLFHIPGIPSVFSMVHLWFRGKRNVWEKKSHLKMKPKSFNALEEIFWRSFVWWKSSLTM